MRSVSLEGGMPLLPVIYPFFLKCLVRMGLVFEKTGVLC